MNDVIRAGCRRCGCVMAMADLSRDGRCPPCEVAYFESRDRLNTGLWYALGFALPMLLFVWVAATVTLPTNVGKIRSFTTGVPMLDFAIMCTFVAVFSGKTVVAIRRWFHRRDFESRPVGVTSSGRRAAL
jgi:hypothetical protein